MTAVLDAEIGLRIGSLDLDVTLSISAGEVVALLGPNGAGKTTVLRTLAGLQVIERGHIDLDGGRLDSGEAGPTPLPPERRSIGVVFQEYLLFPHLSVLDNVAFGLRSRGSSRRNANAAAASWIERVGLSDLVAAKPTAISGGQAQRVALARALAPGPRLLLLDEPLAALDATTRVTVRRDLRRHLDEFGGATVLVTHDALDALALADRVVILEDGSITQQGSIAEVTARPRTSYVAELLGVNLLRGMAHDAGNGDHVVDLEDGATSVTIADRAHGATLLLIRPNSISLHRTRPDTSARNQWHCQISGFDLLGDHVRVRLSGDIDLVAEVTPSAVGALGLVEGSAVWASVKATDIVAYER